MKKKLFFLFFVLIFNISAVYAVEVIPQIRVLIQDYTPEISIKSDKNIFFYENINKEPVEISGNTNIKAFDEYILIDSNGKTIQSFSNQIYFKPSENSLMEINQSSYGYTIEIKKAGQNIRAINHLPLEDYLLGVLPYELNSKYIEAMKAQAVISRTYAYARILASKKNDYDIRSDYYHQVYGGHKNIEQDVEDAVKITRGLVICLNDKIAQYICYHSTCAGATENNEFVFFTKPVDYLRSVKCTYNALNEYKQNFIINNNVKIQDIKKTDDPLCEGSKYIKWQVSINLNDVETNLPFDLKDKIGKISGFEVIKKGISGRTAKLKIKGERNEYIVNGDKIRSIFKFMDNDRFKNIYSTFIEL